MAEDFEDGDWLIEEFGRGSSTVALLELACQRRPDAPILRWRGGEWSAEQLRRQAGGVAKCLRSLGCEHGARVAVFAKNSPRFVAAWCGIAMAGMVEVPVNTELRGTIFKHVVTDSDPSIMLVEPDFADLAGAVAPHGAKIVSLDDAAMAAWCELPEIDYTSPEPDELASISYTSGTTGPSKGAMLPHAYYPNCGLTWARSTPLKRGDVVYHALPWFHLDARVLVPMALLSGTTVAIGPRFSASRFWDDLDDLGATWFTYTGSLIAVVADRPQLRSHRGRVRFAVGSPTPASAAAYLEDQLGIQLFELYGQSEADGVTFCTPDARRRGSAGRPVSGFEVRIVDVHGWPLGPGQVGEILYRPTDANMMFQGYWRRDEVTARTFRDLWMHTGDLGTLDDDGFLWFRGRLKDAIRRRGENISCYELEHALRAAPGVRDAVTIPVPDPMGGEEDVKAFVVADSETFDPQRFFDFCDDNIPRFAIPRYIQIVADESLPRGPGTGAVQKHLLSTATNGPGVIQRNEPARS